MPYMPFPLKHAVTVYRRSTDGGRPCHPHEIVRGAGEVLQPGDIILVVIDGAEVVTTIDSEGVQRLPCDPTLRLLVDIGTIDLNAVAVHTYRHPEDTPAVRKLYQSIGYSVCGYCEVFPRDTVANPLWQDNSDTTAGATP